MHHTPATKHRIAANLDDQKFAALAEMADEPDVWPEWSGRQALLEVFDRDAIFERKTCSDRVHSATSSGGRNSSCVRVRSRFRRDEVLTRYSTMPGLTAFRL